MLNRRAFLKRMQTAALTGVALSARCTGGESRAESDGIATGRRDYIAMVESHLEALAAVGRDNYGPVKTGMWLASIDTRNRRPLRDNKAGRVYRLIGAPNGSSFYWDQPLVVAGFELTRLTRRPQYARMASEYIEAFLDRCVADDGMFEWGNHKYYDVYTDEIVGFSGSCHELRPITPAWELLWQHDFKACDRYIRRMCERHVYDKATGGFNRHDDGNRGHAFIEAGGILAESAAWLYGKTQDRQCLDTALRIARYSYGHRGENTGLLVNEPDNGRWDSKVATTETGVWAQSLLRAAEYTGSAEFVQMAGETVAAYLKYGFDTEAGQYYGQLDVQTGEPVAPQAAGYWPGEYSRIWNPDQWPTHDYPMAMAKSSLSLYEKTSDEAFLEGVRRWASVIDEDSHAPRDQAVYAEQYGRCIDFLARAGRVLGNDRWLQMANRLADDAVERMYENGMFQGYPGGHVYESVDGVGFLALALISLQVEDNLCAYGMSL